LIALAAALALVCEAALARCGRQTGPAQANRGAARRAVRVSGAGSVPTFAGNAQHTANFGPVAQDLNAIHWSTSIDLNNTGGFAHYGAPLITSANTVLVPVKTASDGFQINAFNGAGGTAKYTLTTDYILPSHNWIPTYQPVLAARPLGLRLYYPGAGGTVYYIDNPDSGTPGAPVHQVFYTSLVNYQANAAAFNSSVFVNTPLTADSNGNVFFGFRVQGTAPSPLSTTQSGFARIDPSGIATYVLAGTAANDAAISSDSQNCAPALSNDESTLYVVVKSGNTDYYAYLLGLDAITLARKYRVFLKDPRNGNANNAGILDDSTGSATVAPDNDVYLGIFGNPYNGTRGFLLRFSGDLAVEKTPGGFGWDYTAAIVPKEMAPSYAGSSPYLIFAKYNNYANVGIDSGDGVNRIALLDPNSTEVESHASSNGMLVMREVLTVAGPTPDAANFTIPDAVREWCINTAAVNPATGSIFTPSEDGHIYRWNLATNSLSQVVPLTQGIGEPYVPTVIGPDGVVYTLNGGTLFALGGLDGVRITLSSSNPDIRGVVAGQSLTFTAEVANTGVPGNTPTGTVTFQDTVYQVDGFGVLGSTTTVLAANVPLDGSGRAAVSIATLGPGDHFVHAAYSGDANFTSGGAGLVQKIHDKASSTTLGSSLNPSHQGETVVLTATVAAVPPSTQIPSGMATFRKGATVLAQVPLNGSGAASFSTAALSVGSHAITADFSSDTHFAASGGDLVQQVQASPSGSGFFTITACRVADTRNAPGPSGGPALAANSLRAFPVADVCQIPASATAVAVNLAVFLPTNNGHLRIYPSGGVAPLASSINFRPGIVRANNAIVALGAGGQISVQCDMTSGETHFFFDVYGYFQ
jgi:hypothetical protein